MSTIKIPEILLPKTEDMTAWSVNACDQFTSDKKYWEEVEKLTCGKLSTYNLIYPEIYLKDNPEQRIKTINRNMDNYVSNEVFKAYNGFILVERTTQSGTRTGLMISVDLEDYSFERGAKTLIRSTEATILERIPPRVNIRKNAPIELPHVMLLFDDGQNIVFNSVEKGEILYDFDLNMNGGHVKGFAVNNPEKVIDAFYSLLNSDTLINKYGKDEKFLFAVGDGNHSLATAKTCWEKVKATLSEEEQKTHPARYALCEVVNIYDNSLNFEPIHRLLITDKAKEFANNYITNGEYSAYVVIDGQKQKIAFNANVPEGIRELDNAISSHIQKFGGEVDYIHGEKELFSFSNQGVGVVVPPIAKNDFFRLIINGGNLPRKTFSMGEGNEKRYYIEAKRIK